MGLIWFYGGQTHHLIPLYAVGVFLSFTLSQTGMIVHHLKVREPGWKLGLLINLLGAIATALVLLVIGGTKFIHGAWIIILLISLLVTIFYKISRHYLLLSKQLNVRTQDRDLIKKSIQHKVIIPVSGVHRGIIQAIAYGKIIAQDIEALYVELDPEMTGKMVQSWKEFDINIPLKILVSPYRSINEPLLSHINELLKDQSIDFITVIIPEFVTARWWENFLHNQSALFIKTALMFKRRVVVTSIRYHLKR